MANDAIQIFDGTPTEVILMTGTLAAGNFSVHSTNATITEFNNSVDLWPHAVATINIKDGWSVAPSALTSVDLFMFKQDVDGTSDETAPSLSSSEGAHYCGSFIISDSTSAQLRQIVISLAGVRKCKFAIQNRTGQTISYTTGATVDIEGFTYTPST